MPSLTRGPAADETLAGRKTEEGFLIYKEAELRISPEAGGMVPYMRLS